MDEAARTRQPRPGPRLGPVRSDGDAWAGGEEDPPGRGQAQRPCEARREFSIQTPLLSRRAPVLQQTLNRKVAGGNSPHGRSASWTPVGEIKLAIDGEGEDKPSSSRGASVLSAFGLFGVNTGKHQDGNTDCGEQSMIFESYLDLTPERISHIFHTLDADQDGLVSYDGLRRGIDEWSGIDADVIGASNSKP